MADSEQPLASRPRLLGLLLSYALAACWTAYAPASSKRPAPSQGDASDVAGSRVPADRLRSADAVSLSRDGGTAPVDAAADGRGEASAKELPRGGRQLFPAYRLVGFCGTPGAPALGELQGNLPAKARALESQAGHYGDQRPILPVFELIAVVVQSGAGPDGKYRRRVDSTVVDEYLRVARKFKALLLLNIQPGQSDFLTEVKAFDTYLREPDVGVALDPEWAIKPKQRPGAVFGQTTGETVDEVADYLAALVAAGELPEKALVFHEVNRDVLKNEAAIRPALGVVLIKSVDGLGPIHAKIATYGNLMEIMPAGVHPGFKLFFDEDTRNGSHLMNPKQVLALKPQPEYVMYE